MFTKPERTSRHSIIACRSSICSMQTNTLELNNENHNTIGFICTSICDLDVISRVCAAQEFQEQVKVQFQHAIPNVQGKSVVAVIVNYPPGGKSPAHRHAPSAFIYAYVLSGSIRSKVGDEPAKVYKAGESFYEEPGSHHTVSENASAKDPASLLVVFVIDSEHSALTIPDKR